MPNWDVFHSDRLEVERNLDTEQVRNAITQGTIREDDMARLAGTEDPWRRIGDMVALLPPKTTPPAPAAPKTKVPTSVLLDDLSKPPAVPAGTIPSAGAVIADDRADMRAQTASAPRPGDSDLALPVYQEEPEEAAYDPLAEDAEAADFTFSARGGREKEEDLDLAAMVDVAFQLILFFLVTASTVFFKSVEIPPPDPEKSKAGQQAISRSIEDLQNENILVEIDARGQFLLDHEPIPADALAGKMRAIRESTGRNAMLLMADRATPHKYVVQALDAANEISIAIKVGRASDSE